MRRAAAHVPEEVAFATKPQLARGMIERAIAATCPSPGWQADSVYGVSEIEMMLRRQAKAMCSGSAARISSARGRQA
jgi:SRSO17 transposase